MTLLRQLMYISYRKGTICMNQTMSYVSLITRITFLSLEPEVIVSITHNTYS